MRRGTEWSWAGRALWTSGCLFSNRKWGFYHYMKKCEIWLNIWLVVRGLSKDGGTLEIFRPTKTKGFGMSWPDIWGN